MSDNGWTDVYTGNEDAVKDAARGLAHADALRRKARKLMRTIDRAQKHALDSKEPYGSNAGSHRQEEGA